MIVSTAGGGSITSSADKFTYNASLPVLTGLSPSTGSTSGGTTVTITGTNLFGATVSFGSTLGAIISDSPTQIIVTSPPEVAGTVDVTVMTAGGTTATSTADHFTFVAGKPAVTSVSPATDTTNGGATVTITGTNLFGATAVSFGGTSGSIVSDSPTQITAVDPAHVAGMVDVTATTAGGTSNATSADQFTYNALPPALTAISPNTGSTSGGTTVTITGTNLLGATVAFGTTLGAIVSDAPTQIIVTSPYELFGTVDVTVTTTGGTTSISAADRFTYVAFPPTVTGLSQTSDTTNGDTTITIAGTNLWGASGVSFGSVAASSFSVVSPTQITAVDPAHVVGTVDVTVTVATAGGADTSATSTADRFTFVANRPAVTSVNPTGGGTSGGSTVTITGTNLFGATFVLFGSVPATTILTNSPTQITVVDPPQLGGTVDVTVATAGGTSPTSPADQFVYTARQPVVTALSPKQRLDQRRHHDHHQRQQLLRGHSGRLRQPGSDQLHRSFADAD